VEDQRLNYRIEKAKKIQPEPQPRIPRSLTSAEMEESSDRRRSTTSVEKLVGTWRHEQALFLYPPCQGKGEKPMRQSSGGSDPYLQVTPFLGQTVFRTGVIETSGKPRPTTRTAARKTVRAVTYRGQGVPHRRRSQGRECSLRGRVFSPHLAEVIEKRDNSAPTNTGVVGYSTDFRAVAPVEGLYESLNGLPKALLTSVFHPPLSGYPHASRKASLCLPLVLGELSPRLWRPLLSFPPRTPIGIA